MTQKRNLPLIRKLLEIIQNNVRIVVPKESFGSPEEEEIQAFEQLKEQYALSEYSDAEISYNLNLLGNYDIISGFYFDRKITAFGCRFLSLLQNDALLSNLQNKIGSTFDLYTPQTLVSLAQQVDLHEKGFKDLTEKEPALPDENDILKLEELISHAKDVTKDLDQSLSNVSSVTAQMQSAKKELDEKIRHAEIVLYP